MSKSTWIILAAVLLVLLTVFISNKNPQPNAPSTQQEPSSSVSTSAPTSAPAREDYLRAVYSPLHFKPAAENATNEQCLECHQEVLEDGVRAISLAGVKAADSLAWYQRFSIYQGEQDTFHRRHMETPLAKRLMNLQCNTCHQGHDPREEAPGSSATGVSQDTQDIVLRKQVNPESVCLKCHGQFPYRNMELPGPWHEIGEQMGNDCMLCHANIRTVRHQVSYLNPDAIEEDGKTNATEVCYGCHGGRPWYRISYPYPRHWWMPDVPSYTPDWAKDRPLESEPRFINPVSTAAH